MIRYLDPTNDVAFKKLFSKKERLMDLLNSILMLKEGVRIIDLEYIPLEQMPLFLEGKRSIFDLKVSDELGRWYIIEMQRKTEKDYLNRVQFYGSYTYVTQIEEGIKHKDLLPVIVISIIGTTVFPDDIPCISYHCFKEDSTHKQYLKSLTYVFVELGKYKKEQVTTDIDQWLHLLKCAHKEQEPPVEIQNDNILSAYNDLEQFRWSAQEHDAYVRSRLAAEAEEEAMESKYEKGVVEGEKRGKLKASLAIAKNLLANGLSRDAVATATSLELQEIEKLLKS